MSMTVLTNDDGIQAPGLMALYDVLRRVISPLTVVAPRDHQSAKAHGITTYQRIHVQQIAMPDGVSAYSVAGLPADCVKLALNTSLVEPCPDLVISGINAGANVANHVFYSGTVAAAMEAAMYNVPAVAFSAMVGEGQLDFPRIARFCGQVLESLRSQDMLRPGIAMNVNIPDLKRHGIRGVRVVPHSTLAVADNFQTDTDEDGQLRYWLGPMLEPEQEHNDCDRQALRDGYITVTPLHCEINHRNHLDYMQKWQTPDIDAR